MSWSYSGDPASSPKDEVRFLIQDTDSGVPLLTDEEIDYLLGVWMDRYGSATYVASVAADQISRKFAGLVSVSADGVSVDVAKISEKYATMAAALRSEYERGQIGGSAYVAGIMVGEQPDYSIKPLSFGIGIHDNPLAGQQDYGAWGDMPLTEIPG